MLAIEIVGGCTSGPVPATLAASTWLRTDPEDGFVRTSRRADIARALAPDGAAPLLSRPAPCGGPGR